MGVPVHENFLRDTVNVPYSNGRLLTYPSVRIRMDFRDPNTVGTFPYHCHLLEHEDKGMMGTIEVAPSTSTLDRSSPELPKTAKPGDDHAREASVAKKLSAQ
jgi:hypothetical protein